MVLLELLAYSFQFLLDSPIANHESLANNVAGESLVPEGEDIDGRDRSAWHELERRIFEELVSRDNRYFANKEQWSVVLADLKQMALDKNAPVDIAQFLREKRAMLL